MTEKEFFIFMLSTEGKGAIHAARRILHESGPEIPDADILKKIIELGMPQWAAARVFYHFTMRFAPLTCKYCSREYIPRSVFTMSRPYCHTCRRDIVFGPRPPDAAFKDEARRETNNLLSRRKISRQPCETCGHRWAQAHHTDYSKPYLITWLCSRCHAAEHKRLRDEAKAKAAPVLHPMSAIRRKR